MNQAEKQFNFDLQIFAEEGTPEIAPEATPEVTTETAPAEAAAPAQTDSTPEPEKHISEMTDDEQTEYIKKHFLNEGGRPRKEDKPQEPQGQGEAVQPPQEPQAEPTLEIVHNGEKKRVTQSELINLAQQGFDYTQKTQALAQQRRELEAQIAQYRQRNQQVQQPQLKPTERMNAQYREAVGAACRSMGITPEEFNQFDPVHAFALQNVIVQANMRVERQVSERQAVENEVREFMGQIQDDPMTNDVNEHFTEFILRRGLESKQGAEIVGNVAMAYQRLKDGTVTRQDCKVLKEHWAYVKSQLSKAQAPVAPPAPPKPPIVPPKTETPGVGRSANNGGGVMDVRKLRSLANDPDRQMQYMKSLGIFND